MSKFTERAGAVMLVASTGDPYALRTAHNFEALGRAARSTDRRRHQRPRHGAAAPSPDLVTGLVDWFRRSLL